MDSSSGDFAQPNAAYEALLYILVDSSKSVLKRHRLVATSGLKDVNLLAAVENPEAVVDGPANLGGFTAGVVGVQACGALHHQDDLVRVLGILGKVALEEGERVVLGCSVELGGVPEVHAFL